MTAGVTMASVAEAADAGAAAQGGRAPARVTLRNLALGYDGAPAVARLDGTFEPGSLTALVGPNGAGKSTLLKGLAGLLAPLSGEIRRDGGAVAYLPQQTEIDASFPARVSDLVALGLWGRRGMLGRIRAADRADIEAALGAVGLPGFERRSIEALSGGELRRALFARVILQDAGLILLDEPFNAIDAGTVADLLRIVRRWHDEGRTVVAALHNLDLVRAYFPATLLLAREPVVWGRTEEALRRENLLSVMRLEEGWADEAPWARRSAA